MSNELDKTLNRKNNFTYPRIEARREIRLLRLPHEQGCDGELHYFLEVVPLDTLSSLEYKALSYTWGHAHSKSDVQAVRIEGQQFAIRRNLSDFLVTAALKGESGLYFVDAICINQVDHTERQHQVQGMARIYRNANQVIAWLGIPEKSQLANVRALSQTTSSFREDCDSWTSSQWEGFRYLSYHNFWRRIWIVQEVLLASSMVVWCGSFVFPLTLLGGASATRPGTELRFSQNGRPATVTSYSSSLHSPAATIITHRLRHIPRPLKDYLDQGTNIGTLEEMTKNLTRPCETIATYQSEVPDLLHHAVRKFGKLECSDPRDRLYGLLGILNERSRAKVEADYGRGVEVAYYQALKVGLQELYSDRQTTVRSHYKDSDGGDPYLGYYCDVRDAFRIEDGPSLEILQQVLVELNFQSQIQDDLLDAQLRQRFMGLPPVVKATTDFTRLLMLADETTEPRRRGLLFKFHKKQLHILHGLSNWRFRRIKSWDQLKEMAD